MTTLVKRDHMVSVSLLSFKISNHKYAMLDHMTFLFFLNKIKMSMRYEQLSTD